MLQHEGAKGICPTDGIYQLYRIWNTYTAVSSDGNALKEIGQGTGNGAGDKHKRIFGTVGGQPLVTAVSLSL